MSFFFAPQSASLDTWSLWFWVRVLQVSGKHFGHLIASWYSSFSLASQCLSHPPPSSAFFWFWCKEDSNESDTSFIWWHAFKQSAGSKPGKCRTGNPKNEMKLRLRSHQVMESDTIDSQDTISSYSAFTLSHRTLDLMMLWHLKTNIAKMAGWMTHSLSKLMILEPVMNLKSPFEKTTKASGFCVHNLHKSQGSLLIKC